MKVLFVTICTGAAPSLVERASRRLRLPLVVTQRGTPWTGFYHNKVVRLYQDVKDLSWDVLLYVDAHDVFPTQRTTLERSLEALGDKGFLFSGETNCWPWPARHKPFYETEGLTKHRFPYANAGVWIAQREAYLKYVDWALGWNDGYEEQERSVERQNCDQLHANEMVVSGRASVEVDGAWCLNLYNLSPDEAADRLFKSSPMPTLVHGSSWETKPLVRKLYDDLVRSRR